MGVHVTVQVRLLSELFATDCTLIWRLPVVHGLMPLESRKFGKLLVAYGAFVGTKLSVSPFVLPQSLFGGEDFGAALYIAAEEHVLVCVLQRKNGLLFKLNGL